MANHTVICMVLDELDPIIDDLAKKFELTSEDIETVLDTLREKFRSC